jgi:hypothetical protein
MGGGFGSQQSSNPLGGLQSFFQQQQQAGLGSFMQQQGGVGVGAQGFNGLSGGMPAQNMGQFDQRAIAADPQGFKNWMQNAMMQEKMHPGSTMLTNRGQIAGGQIAYAADGGLSQDKTGIAAMADGGYNLGSYSDGGRLLRGPGDGVSDSIPATIGKNQPARLADGEFVVPARIVSEIGNGSTEAGARKLYQMMDRIQQARSKTVGKNKVAANTRAEKYLPA